jgi:hypothetical protein
MIALRDILIFAGLMALAAAVVASLFPVREGVSPVPACSDCAFKLTGGYWIRQYGNYASLYLGTREAARYGWAYVDGGPLSAGEAAGCDPMYLWVLNGIAYVSCSGSNNPAFGREVGVLAPAAAVDISANPLGPGCAYTADVITNVMNGTMVTLYVYDAHGRLVYSSSGAAPTSFTFSVPAAGAYRMHVYAPPLLDSWYTLYAGVNVVPTKAVVYTGNNTQDLRPAISLKVFDLTGFWKKGYTSVVVYVDPGMRSFALSAPSNAFADFLLAWEDCPTCDPTYGAVYVDEAWRLTFTNHGPVLARVFSQGGYWHKVYADGNLIWAWNTQGPKQTTYNGADPSIDVRFVSPASVMNAEALFTKTCSWS